MEWDEARASSRNRPFHNWASHGADSVRNFAQGFVVPEIVRLQGENGRRRIVGVGVRENTGHRYPWQQCDTFVHGATQLPPIGAMRTIAAAVGLPFMLFRSARSNP
jgi:hypothetical protein